MARKHRREAQQHSAPGKRTPGRFLLLAGCVTASKEQTIKIHSSVLRYAGTFLPCVTLERPASDHLENADHWVMQVFPVRTHLST